MANVLGYYGYEGTIIGKAGNGIGYSLTFKTADGSSFLFRTTIWPRSNGTQLNYSVDGSAASYDIQPGELPKSIEILVNEIKFTARGSSVEHLFEYKILKPSDLNITLDDVS